MSCCHGYAMSYSYADCDVLWHFLSGCCVVNNSVSYYCHQLSLKLLSVEYIWMDYLEHLTYDALLCHVTHKSDILQ